MSILMAINGNKRVAVKSKVMFFTLWTSKSTRDLCENEIRDQNEQNAFPDVQLLVACRRGLTLKSQTRLP